MYCVPRDGIATDDPSGQKSQGQFLFMLFASHFQTSKFVPRTCTYRAHAHPPSVKMGEDDRARGSVPKSQPAVSAVGAAYGEGRGDDDCDRSTTLTAHGSSPPGRTAPPAARASSSAC